MSTTIQYIAEHPYPLIVGLAVIAGLLFTALPEHEYIAQQIMAAGTWTPKEQN